MQLCFCSENLLKLLYHLSHSWGDINRFVKYPNHKNTCHSGVLSDVIWKPVNIVFVTLSVCQFSRYGWSGITATQRKSGKLFLRTRISSVTHACRFVRLRGRFKGHVFRFLVIVIVHLSNPNESIEVLSSLYFFVFCSDEWNMGVELQLPCLPLVCVGFLSQTKDCLQQLKTPCRGQMDSCIQVISNG